MKILLVYGRFPVTYWGFQYSLHYIDCDASLPPLGLLSLAALLPDDWDLRLVDLNIDSLEDAHLEWADAVFLSGMHIQTPSLKEVVLRAKDAGLKTVVGGPAPTTAGDEEFANADIVFKGEAEGRIDDLLNALESGEKCVLEPVPGSFPDITQAPVPRYDLIDVSRYSSVSLQYSRGCPFNCEFCYIIEIFGRKPRVKNRDQVLAELDAIRESGYTGSTFFVDDNFIGNRSRVKKLMPALVEWQEEHGFPLDFYTEASINLAKDEELLQGMVKAGFSSVFLGIETPSLDALKASGKTQNLAMDLSQAVEHITRTGIEVMGGFILGFDQDDADTIRCQHDFISSLPVPLAMVGLLNALPGTALWKRLESQGRLKKKSFCGDQFGRMNFIPVLDESILLKGYAELLGSIYSPGPYYDRTIKAIKMTPVPKRRIRKKVTLPDIRTLFRLFWNVGVKRAYRRYFWKLFFYTLFHSPKALAWAMAQVIRGEHLIEYTVKDVIPRTEKALSEIKAGRIRTDQDRIKRIPSASLRKAPGLAQDQAEALSQNII